MISQAIIHLGLLTLKIPAEFNIINAVMIELSKQVEQRKLQDEPSP